MIAHPASYAPTPDFFFSSRRRHTRWPCDWSSDVCSSDLSLEGSLDSLRLEARASGERLQWRSWAVPRGRVRFAYRPGPVPVFELEATLDSLAHGVLGFGAAAASARGTRDSLTWFARSRVGEG